MKIKINGTYYQFFNKLSIAYTLDSVASVFSFEGRFDVNNTQHKSIFKPLSYNDVEIYDDNDLLLLTGVVVNTTLGSNSGREFQTLSGYSKAGILEDCSIPVSSYPLEKLNVSLDDVVSRLLQDFDLKYVVDTSVLNAMQLQYDKTVAEPTESVKSFISKLTSQRDIILGHNEKGDIRFFKLVLDSKPILYLTDENSSSMTLSVAGQGFHSQISVIRQPSKDNTSLTAVDTVINPMVKKNRYIVETLSSGTETDTKNAANSTLAKQLKGISFTVVLNSITNLKCGDLVEVMNPEVYLYKRTKLVVSEIKISQDSSSSSTELTLVIPEAFTGNEPKNIFEND